MRGTIDDSGILPSKKVTAPVGVLLPEAVTLAVKVTFFPKMDGLAELDNPIDVGFLVMVWGANTAKGESDITTPQMTWLTASNEVVTFVHALFSKWNRAGVLLKTIPL